MNRTALIVLLLSLSVRGYSAAQITKDSTRPPDSTASAAPQAYSDSASRVAADTGRSVKPDPGRTDPSKPPSSKGDSAGAIPTSRGLTGPSIDSSLVTACQADSSGTPAGGVLLVVFTGQTAPADKARAIKAVGGTLAGKAATGEEYVAVPDTIPLHTAADSLIQQPGVVQIRERPC